MHKISTADIDISHHIKEHTQCYTGHSRSSVNCHHHPSELSEPPLSAVPPPQKTILLPPLLVLVFVHLLPPLLYNTAALQCGGSDMEGGAPHTVL